MTASPVPLHAAPSAGFDQPFEMLAACHERVERMLGLLERLARHLGEAGADAPARQAALDVMRYFDIAGPAHHEDEERHVLPRLAASGDTALQALAARLHDEHHRMSAAWLDVRGDLTAIAAGDASAVANGAVPTHWKGFAGLYQAHIEAEERIAYPVAKRGLDAAGLTSMGVEMAARRGAPPPVA